MSFTINSNTSAQNALFNLNNTSGAFNASIERLSSGLKINSAADNPAGLIISDKYTAQLGGINQAIQNSQDGINFAKTADGALTQVITLLDDARGLAVSSANTGTLSTSAIQANQSQLQSIAAAITRIATTTQFGSKNLLDGSAGVNATVTDSTNVATINIGSDFAGVPITSNSGVTLTVQTAATQATLTSKAYAFATSTAGSNSSFTLNGVTFNVAASDTATSIVSQINQAQAQTGIVASYDATNGDIKLNTSLYGSNQSINLTDASGVLSAAPGFTSATGTNAVAQVQIGGTTVLFTGGINGADGLTLADSDGNTIQLTAAGNNTTVADAAVGQVVAGSAQFQIGAFAGQTANLSIGNMSASNLGVGVASGINLSNLDLTTATGASLAIKVIDAAIGQVSQVQGNIGNFQRNVLQTNVATLGVAQQNLQSANSTIMNTDVAAETTNYTRLQIMQQAGISVLAQANQAPQAVLKLLG